MQERLGGRTNKEWRGSENHNNSRLYYAEHCLTCVCLKQQTGVSFSLCLHYVINITCLFNPADSTVNLSIQHTIHRLGCLFHLDFRLWRQCSRQHILPHFLPHEVSTSSVGCCRGVTLAWGLFRKLTGRSEVIRVHKGRDCSPTGSSVTHRHPIQGASARIRYALQEIIELRSPCGDHDLIFFFGAEKSFKDRTAPLLAGSFTNASSPLVERVFL